MEKVGEDEKKIIEDGSSVEETRSDKEDEKVRGTERFDPEGSMDPSNSHTVTFEYHDDSEYEMEDEEVLELFRRNSGVRPKVSEMLTRFQEEAPDEVFHSLNESNEIADLGAVSLYSPEILEGIKSSSSASNEDTEDSSSNSDHDSNLSRYYFDGSLPVSDHVEEYEIHQYESSVSKDENQVPLLYPKKTVQRPTSWRNCCGLLALLRATDP